MVVPVQSDTFKSKDTLKEKNWLNKQPSIVKDYFDVPQLGNDLYLLDPEGDIPIVTYD